MTMPFDGYGLIQEIDVRLTVELGRKNLPLREILALGENSVVELDRLTDEPLDIMVNGRLIARGEVVAQGNRFAIRILELVGQGTGAGAAAPVAAPQVAPQGGAEVPVEDRRAPPPTSRTPPTSSGCSPSSSTTPTRCSAPPSARRAAGQHGQRAVLGGAALAKPASSRGHLWLPPALHPLEEPRRHSACPRRRWGRRQAAPKSRI